MNLELGFIPDTVVYLKFENDSLSHHTVWGDENVYLNAIDYILNICEKKSSFIAIKKGLGKIKVFQHEIQEYYV